MRNAAVDPTNLTLSKLVAMEKDIPHKARTIFHTYFLVVKRKKLPKKECLLGNGAYESNSACALHILRNDVYNSHLN